jgi:hypothetical protein
VTGGQFQFGGIVANAAMYAGGGPYPCPDRVYQAELSQLAEFHHGISSKFFGRRSGRSKPVLGLSVYPYLSNFIRG